MRLNDTKETPKRGRRDENYLACPSFRPSDLSSPPTPANNNKTNGKEADTLNGRMEWGGVYHTFTIDMPTYHRPHPTLTPLTYDRIRHLYRFFFGRKRSRKKQRGRGG
ncbi:hypothetical protein LOAG_13972 [Loa loa]|uniref:Uncharacterized protein n=1 Tax=Loa loa TaxID=7209 RepID=A0A1S0TID2_LOALO|nr:hypothetical protein LOAG_13972 [Loa loa]EFO14544.1 hypothetical protein LOAG_13972 [Loa loa]